MQCSGNMGQVIHQLKMACLSYTSSPITYQEKRYQLSELLRVKAKVISECQKLIRTNLHKTPEYDGIMLRNKEDEHGFIIEPLLNAMPMGDDAWTKI